LLNSLNLFSDFDLSFANKYTDCRPLPSKKKKSRMQQRPPSIGRIVRHEPESARGTEASGNFD